MIKFDTQSDRSLHVDALDQRAWDDLAAGFSDLSYEQTSVFADAKWGGDKSSTLLVTEDGKAVACARLLVVRLPILMSGLAYVKFGPLWRLPGAPPDAARYRAILAALVEEYCERRGHMLTVLPRPCPDTIGLETEMLREAGFQVRRPFADAKRYLVAAHLSEAEQLASLSQKWRYNLRQGLKNGVEVVGFDLDAGIDEFVDMHGGMIQRKRFADRDAVGAHLPAMATSAQALRPLLFFARKDGRNLAGAVVGRTGDVPVYLFGASRDEATELNAGYVLQWWIVNWLREMGERWYDLGGGALEPRLEQFKRGLVGKAGCALEMPGEFDRWSGTASRLAGDFVYSARGLETLARSALGR